MVVVVRANKSGSCSSCRMLLLVDCVGGVGGGRRCVRSPRQESSERGGGRDLSLYRGRRDGDVGEIVLICNDGEAKINAP